MENILALFPPSIVAPFSLVITKFAFLISRFVFESPLNSPLR